MSTKYNRNDANAGDDKFYLNDFKTELNGVEQDDREQSKDFELLPCIVSGLGLTPAAYPSTNVTVAPGIARDKDGRRIQIASSQIVQITDTVGGNNYVILSHKYSEDTPRKAFSTGTEYDTRKYDDFELAVASTYSSDDIVLGNVKVECSENVLYIDERTPYVAKPVRKEPPPPVPIHLDLETGWDDAFRKTGASAGLVSFKPAYILAEFGDRGNGTASGITFTMTDNRIDDWTTDEWIGYYLTCADGNSWRVESNTSDTLTLSTGSVPVTGVFHLGPNAAGYKWVIQTLHPDTEAVQATQEGESQYMESPVKVDRIFHSVTPDIKYRIKVASKGGWFQEEWSEFSTPAEEIAGGAKEIPDACGDTLDGDPTITAEDDGIRISWSVKALYQDKVGGFELCWTDDGVTNPDFDNKNHRKIFTDRNYVVLPAKLSSDDTTVKVKVRMRAVDKAGRHCVTPKTLDDTDAKKYPADLSTIVTDYKNTLEEGSFSTLEGLLSQSINLENGRSKMVSEIESEMADARGSYATVGARIAAILQGDLDWQDVRIVAKEGGQYTSIQAAINSICGSNVTLILVMPGTYTEDIDVKTNKVGIVGLGHTGEGVVKIIGKIGSSDSFSRIFTLQNLYIYKSGTLTTDPGVDIAMESGSPSFLSNVYIDIASEVAGLRFSGEPGIRMVNVRISNGAGYCLKVLRTSSSGSNINIILCHFSTGSFDAVFIDESTGTDYVILGVLWSTLSGTSGSHYSVNAGAGAASYLRVSMAQTNLVVCLAPNGTNLTVYYGTLENVSNVRFSGGQLPGPL